jgi:transcriptional regulator with XRE-family HTH domain
MERAAVSPGSTISQLRRGSGISQAELASRMGTTQSAIARLEAGRLSPSFRTLEKAFAALGHRVELVADPPLTHGSPISGLLPPLAQARAMPYGQAAIDAVDATQIRAGRQRTPDQRLNHLAGSTRGLRRLLDGIER